MCVTQTQGISLVGLEVQGQVAHDLPHVPFNPNLGTWGTIHAETTSHTAACAAINSSEMKCQTQLLGRPHWLRARSQHPRAWSPALGRESTHLCHHRRLFQSLLWKQRGRVIHFLNQLPKPQFLNDQLQKDKSIPVPGYSINETNTKC